MLINMLCILCYLIRDTSVPKKFCQVFPVIFYGIIGATIINIAVVTIKNAVRMWSPEKAKKVKKQKPLSPLLRAFVIYIFSIYDLVLDIYKCKINKRNRDSSQQVYPNI